MVVGINLLREGLDIPEVSLIGILDADKEGFLRSDVSLVQIIGRAARHSEGRVIMYADNVTGSIRRAVEETERRRKIQDKYNKLHNITPKTIEKEISVALEKKEKDDETIGKDLEKRIERYSLLKRTEKNKLLKELELEMLMLSDMLEFEKAAQIRDKIKELKG